jgi:hypothetical protein
MKKLHAQNRDSTMSLGFAALHCRMENQGARGHVEHWSTRGRRRSNRGRGRIRCGGRGRIRCRSQN